jgi:hypothetical protein
MVSTVSLGITINLHLLPPPSLKPLHQRTATWWYTNHQLPTPPTKRLNKLTEHNGCSSRGLKIVAKKRTLENALKSYYHHPSPFKIHHPPWKQS